MPPGGRFWEQGLNALPTTGENRPNAAIELPTILLAIAIHGGWLAATWFHRSLPLPLLAITGGWLIAWHGSLQHETIHGHPTRSRRLNSLIGALPLALWLPYRCYSRDHRAHHATEAITEPLLDSESRYLPREDGRVARLRRGAAHLQSSLVGRLLFGPFVAVVAFLAGECRRRARSPGAVVRDWLPHLVGVGIVLAWLHACGFGIGRYVLLFVYPGTALTMLRSFAEHRAAADPGHRVAIVEHGGPLALLFLNNNLHAVHHLAPGMPWYRLPAFYRRHRAEILRRNGDLRYRSYGAIVRLYAWRRHDDIVHPDHRLPATAR